MPNSTQTRPSSRRSPRAATISPLKNRFDIVAMTTSRHQQTLTVLFERVQAFWTARQVQPGVDFSAAALAATYAVGQASGAMSGPRANQTMAELRSVCRSCHTEFRERIDGGFRIKPGI